MTKGSPRITLFLKIVSGFIVIILFMAAGSLIILQELKSLFSSNQAEFRNVQFLQSLQSSIDAERKTTRAIFTQRDMLRLRLFSVFSRQFDEFSDSIRQLAQGDDMKREIDTLRAYHQGYVHFVGEQVDRLTHDPQYDSRQFLSTESTVLDNLIRRIGHLSDEQIPTLSRALENFQAEREDASISAYVILGLCLLIGAAITVLIAKTLTKPIQALKAGTEKVGEGKYETVAVTTNDEVADLTRAFNLMSEKLRQLDEMRMELMSEISHEMRTPLQVIKAGCYTVIHTKAGPPLSPQQRESVAMIHQATNRINTFVNSFLDIAKMEAGLMKYTFVPCSLQELLSPLIQEVQLIAQTRQITLTFEADEFPPLSLDKERIGQVFSNLLSNALKYTPEQGEIRVRMKKRDDAGPANKNGRGYVRVEVEDTGVGIPQADLAKLFDKFYQAKNVPLVNEKGSGLGLALVKHVAEAHGGAVDVRSTVGAGSTFIVDIPI